MARFTLFYDISFGEIECECGETIFVQPYETNVQCNCEIEYELGFEEVFTIVEEILGDEK